MDTGRAAQQHGPPAKLSKSHSAENITASPGPAPFPSSPDNPAEQVDYGGSYDVSEGPSPSTTPEDPPEAEVPAHCEKELHPNKGVILVSEAFTEINAGLVIVMRSGQTSPVPMSELMDINRDPDELAITITEAYHRHVEAYLATTSPPEDAETAVSSGLLGSPLLGTLTRVAADWCHAWSTGHTPAQPDDTDMAHQPTVPEHTQGADMSSTATSDVTMSEASHSRAHKSRRIDNPRDNRSPDDWVAELRNSRASFLATTAVPEDPAEALRGGLLLTPLMGCKARTPLDWTHAWAMLGEWAGTVAFPIPEQGVEWPRHGHGLYLRPNFIHRTPPFLTWARPNFDKERCHPCRSFQLTSPFSAFLGTNSFRART